MSVTEERGSWLHGSTQNGVYGVVARLSAVRPCLINAWMKCGANSHERDQTNTISSNHRLGGNWWTLAYTFRTIANSATPALLRLDTPRLSRPPCVATNTPPFASLKTVLHGMRLLSTQNTGGRQHHATFWKKTTKHLLRRYSVGQVPQLAR